MAWNVAPTRSPFWLRLNGAWVHLEGVRSGVSVGSERPSSELTAIDGNRYVQKAPLARREWALDFEWATPAGIATLRVAAEAGVDDEVLCYVDSVANMLTPHQTYGDGPVIIAGGVPLPTYAGGEELVMAVRDGFAYTLVWWTSAGRSSGTFTAAGNTHTVPAAAGSAGVMLLEGAGAALPETFSAGESMPCEVVVSDPGDTLKQHFGVDDLYRHDYSVTLREVG